MWKRDFIWLVDDATALESQDLLTLRGIARHVAQDRLELQGFRCLLETPEALLQEAEVALPRKRRASPRRAV